ncbi:MAG: hypothetical protein HOY79_18440 [Streptomyces sp.]|nr:hypothetical protein [Streptomyces sp.]
MAPTVSDTEAAFLARYRTLGAEQRRAIAAQASPRMRAWLVVAEKHLAVDRSPGALAAVLTDRREMQARHLNMVDQAWVDMAEGRTERVMLTMPPRHGKSRRASRRAPLWYARGRRHPPRNRGRRHRGPRDEGACGTIGSRQAPSTCPARRSGREGYVVGMMPG